MFERIIDKNEIDKCIDGYIKLTLMRGCDDYVMAAEIVDNIFNIDECFKIFVDPRIIAAIKKIKSIGEKRLEFELANEMNLYIVKNVLDNELMEIGDLNNGFIKWPINTEAAIWYVNRVWKTFNYELPGLGEYWLKNTKKGNEIGMKELEYWKNKSRGTVLAKT